MTARVWLRILAFFLTIALAVDIALMSYAAGRTGEPPLPWWAFALCIVSWVWVIIVINHDNRISDSDRSKT